MSKEAVQRFFEDQSVRKMLSGGESLEEIVSIGRDNGFDFSMTELVEYLKGLKPAGPLTDDELAKATGGGQGTKVYRAVCRISWCGWTSPWHYERSHAVYLGECHRYDHTVTPPIVIEEANW